MQGSRRPPPPSTVLSPHQSVPPISSTRVLGYSMTVARRRVLGYLCRVPSVYLSPPVPLSHHQITGARVSYHSLVLALGWCVMRIWFSYRDGIVVTMETTYDCLIICFRVMLYLSRTLLSFETVKLSQNINLYWRMVGVVTRLLQNSGSTGY